ncbi:MAG: DotU family type IV/VI secretion system protein [Nannocystaceae bacterium]
MNRVSEVTKDALNAVIQLSNAPKGVAAEVVYARVKERVDEMITRGRDSGMAESDVADITYGVVALADELAQREPSSLAEFWHSQPLQLHYFAENIAGEGFFSRLDRILSEPSRVEALVIFHTCLQLGFEGRYAVRGGERELDLVRRRVRDALGPLLAASPLSRHHERPSESTSGWNLDFVLLWASLFSLLFAACFWLVLRFSLESMSMDLVEHCQQLLDTMMNGGERS